MFVIFNPASGRGRGDERQRTYIELLNEAGVEFEHATTACPGGESDLAERALSNGATTIVAVGGDASLLARAIRDAAAFAGELRGL